MRLKALKRRASSVASQSTAASRLGCSRAVATTSPRERRAMSGRAGVRWLVRPTKKPRAETPSQVPPFSRSRPAKRAGPARGGGGGQERAANHVAEAAEQARAAPAAAAREIVGSCGREQGRDQGGGVVHGPAVGEPPLGLQALDDAAHGVFAARGTGLPRLFDGGI